MRTINNLTGLLFGFALGIMIFLVMIPVHADPLPLSKQQIPLVTAYQDGRLVAAEALPIADSMEACVAVLKAFMASNTPKPGVALLVGCIEAPAVPIAGHHGATTS